MSFSFFTAIYCCTTKQRERYRLRVRAADKGVPASYADVDVDLDVVDRNNKPPIWDSIVYGPKHIKENVPINTVVATVKARLVENMMKITKSFPLLECCALATSQINRYSVA